MDRFRIYNKEKDAFDIEILEPKARGLYELNEMNIKIPYSFIIPKECFLSYRKQVDNHKNTFIQNIICSFEQYIMGISENEMPIRMFSLRCSDKKINNKTYPFPETVLNIGYNLKMKENIIECYGNEFCRNIEDIFIKHKERFVEYVGADENNSLLQLNLRKQLKYFIYNLYKYFEKIYDENNKEISYSFIIQTMVYGNIDARSLTGMCYTRNPYTGEVMDYGRYILKQQGISLGIVKSKSQLDLSMLKKYDIQIYDELKDIMKKVEAYYNDIRYLEYTVQSGELYILQNTVGNRTFILTQKGIE